MQVLGVKIELENADEKFLASCWTDNTEAVIGKPIKVQADLSNKKNPVSTPKPEPGCQKEVHSQNVDDSQDKIRRIDISELRTLPAKNWYIVNNSFLTHGYANYKHLVIKNGYRWQAISRSAGRERAAGAHDGRDIRLHGI